MPATSSPIERAKVLCEKISEAYAGRSVHLIGKRTRVALPWRAYTDLKRDMFVQGIAWYAQIYLPYRTRPSRSPPPTGRDRLPVPHHPPNRPPVQSAVDHDHLLPTPRVRVRGPLPVDRRARAAAVRALADRPPPERRRGRDGVRVPDGREHAPLQREHARRRGRALLQLGRGV